MPLLDSTGGDPAAPTPNGTQVVDRQQFLQSLMAPPPDSPTGNPQAPTGNPAPDTPPPDNGYNVGGNFYPVNPPMAPPPPAPAPQPSFNYNQATSFVPPPEYNRLAAIDQGTPHMDDIQAAAALANEPFRMGAAAVKAATAPITSTIDQNLPQPLQGPAEMAGNFAAGAVPYALGGPLTGASILLQAASTADSWQKGQLSDADATKQMALLVGPLLAGPALKLLVKGAQAAGMGVLDYVKTPEGQRLVGTLQSERGALTPGEPPSEPPAGAEGAPETGASPPVPGDNLPPSPESLSRQGTQGALSKWEAGQEAPKPIESVPPSKATVANENISRDAQEMTADAKARGASPDLAAALNQTAMMLDEIPKGEPLLDANSVVRAAARGSAQATGSLPGVAGKIDAAIQKGMDTSLAYERQQALPIVKAMNAAIEHDLPNVQATGEAVSRAGNLPSYVFEFPNDVTGLSPETRALIDRVHQIGDGHLAIVQAVDPTTGQTVANHLSHIYADEPTQPDLTGPVQRQRGEVSVAQSRQVADWRVLPDAQMKDVPLVEHIMQDLSQTDVAAHDVLFRKALLEKTGSTNKFPGSVAVRNPIFTRPEEGPFYVPKPIADVIDQKYAPAPGFVRSTSAASRLFKGIMVIPGDIGGIAQRLRETGLQSISAGAGLMHHVLTSPMDWSPDSFDRAQFARDGLPQGAQGSVAFESNFPLGKIGAKYGELAKTPWQAVTYFSNLAHEGNLATMKLLGMDTSEETAAGIANRQASADAVRAFRGASLGAQKAGRNALEQWGLLSQQNSRALFSQLGVASNLLRPGVSAAQRLVAAQAVASTAVGIWGVGSLVNMRYGSGTPLKFPVTWDSKTNGFKYNSNWDMIQSKDGSVTPFLPQASLVNAIAKSFTALANEGINRPGGWGGVMPAVGDIAKPWEQFGVGRAGPLPAAGLGAAGIGYTPEGSFSNHLTGNQRFGAALPQPISASKGLFSPSTITNPGPAAAEQLAGTLPPFPPSTIAQKVPGYPDENQVFQNYGPLADAFKPLGFNPSNYQTLTAMKQDFVSRYASQLEQAGMSSAEAKTAAGNAFDAKTQVKAFKAAMSAAQLSFWKQNPALLDKATKDGTLTTVTKAEQEILDAYRRTPALTP